MSGLFNLLIWNVALATGLGIVIALASCLRPLQCRPALRQWLWLMVLVKLLTPPLIPLPILPRADRALETLQIVAAEHGAMPEATSLPATVEVVPIEIRAGRPVETPAKAPAAVARPPVVQWPPILLTASLLITVLLVTRSIVQMIRALRLLTRSSGHDCRASDIAAREARNLRVRRAPMVALVSARMTPLLWVRRGRPAIVLPTALVVELDDEQLALVIRHELAHFVRRDHYPNAIAFVAASLFWWNPVAWWARREMRLAQEACCDALVVASAPQSRRCYAETVLHVIDFLAGQSSPLPHLANGFGEARSVRRRFEMLANEKVTHRLSRIAKVFVACGSIAICCYPVLAQSDSRLQVGANSPNPPSTDAGELDAASAQEAYVRSRLKSVAARAEQIRSFNVHHTTTEKFFENSSEAKVEKYQDLFQVHTGKASKRCVRQMSVHGTLLGVVSYDGETGRSFYPRARAGLISSAKPREVSFAKPGCNYLGLLAFRYKDRPIEQLFDPTRTKVLEDRALPRCVVLECPPDPSGTVIPGDGFKLWLDMDFDFAVRKFQHYELIPKEFRGQPINIGDGKPKSFYVLEVLKFHRVGKVIVPVETRVSYHHTRPPNAGKQFSEYTCVVDVSKSSWNEDIDDRGFTFSYPPGTKVQ